MTNHKQFMQLALDHAKRMEGETWPNPCVGAMLVKNGEVLAKGVTAKGGRPHAETQAIEQAGDAVKGAILYVTLEPCAHDGEAPPCVDAIIRAGIAEVVIACQDPDLRTAGASIQKLRDNGISVVENICEAEAKWQHRGFFSRIQKGRPWVTLKMASSMDGKVALANGQSKWITGEAARNHGHVLRAENDAILSTSRSVANDDAKLTCRLPGQEHRTPLRIVIDRNLILKGDASLFSASDSPVWIMTYEGVGADFKLPTHAELCVLKSSKDWLKDLFAFLGERGLNRVLIETGGTFASALLGSDLVDELQWFTAPILIGNEGISSVKGLGTSSLDGLRHWQLIESQVFDDDRLDVFVKDRG